MNIEWIEQELRRLREANLFRKVRVRQSPHVGGLIQVDSRNLIDFSSNDYLALAADERLIEAAFHTARQVGWGSGASPLVSGNGVWHQRLESELANFEGQKAALLFSSGFAANLSTIATLVGAGDRIFSDQWNHASIIDGCRLSGAAISIYRHCDIDHLSQLLETETNGGRKLIVTDSLFSMDGDFAPLGKLCDLAEKHGAMVMVDEAHATGIYGRSGRGLCEALGVEDRVSAKVGTLSKAFGGSGGFVVGNQSLIDLVRHRGRAYMFSTAIPEACAASSLAALEIIDSEPERRFQLLDSARNICEQLRTANFNLGTSASYIIPVIVGAEQTAIEWSKRLLEFGVFVPAIRPPTVPLGSSRLRISLNASHSASQLNHLVESLISLQAAKR